MKDWSFLLKEILKVVQMKKMSIHRFIALFIFFFCKLNSVYGQLDLKSLQYQNTKKIIHKVAFGTYGCNYKVVDKIGK